MSSRLVRLLVTAAGALLLALLLNLALAQPVATLPRAAERPELTPTAVPTEWFSATALLTTSAASVNAGESLTVTAQLVTTGTCGFTLYNATLRQANRLFIHVAPPTNEIGPPGENPATWQLAAFQSGVTTFTVDFYGETHCDGAWQWRTVRGGAQPVTVTGAALFLPFAPF